MIAGASSNNRGKTITIDIVTFSPESLAITEEVLRNVLVETNIKTFEVISYLLFMHNSLIHGTLPQ